MERGICAYYALQTYKLLKNYQPLKNISNKYGLKIKVSKPWNGLIKPCWFKGTKTEWIRAEY